MTALLAPFASIIAGIAAALLLSNILFFNLWQGAKDDLVTYTAQVSLAQAQNEADTQRRLRESDAATRNIKDDLATALAALRSRPAVRVLQSNCYTGGGITLPKPTAGTDAAPAAPSVDTSKLITAEECQAFLNDGIEDATRLSWLQAWITQQIEASK